MRRYLSTATYHSYCRCYNLTPHQNDTAVWSRNTAMILSCRPPGTCVYLRPGAVKFSSPKNHAQPVGAGRCIREYYGQWCCTLVGVPENPAIGAADTPEIQRQKRNIPAKTKPKFFDFIANLQYKIRYPRIINSEMIISEIIFQE